jgi:hypothetical protein
LDFYADFATRGDVLGLDFGSGPDEWSAKLGEDFLEAEHDETRLSREFGIIDVSFRRAAGTWVCNFVDLRVQQMQWTENAVPEVIRAEYGEFPDLVEFAEIADTLVGRGVAVYRVPLLVPGQTENFYVEEAAAMFSVVAEPGFADLRVGDVYGVDRMLDAAVSPERRARYR